MEYANDGYEDDFPLDNHELFEGGAPVLSSVEICGISLRSCKLPIDALTDLTLSTSALAAEMTFEEFFDAFADMAPTLISLQLEGIILRVEPGELCFPTNFPSLTSLVIRYPDYLDEGQDDGDYISNLWDCINAPALESLTLYWMDGEQFHTIMDSLQRQRVPSTAKEGLKSLCLIDINVDDYADDLTLACPNLSNLTLVGDATVPVLKFILEVDQQKSMAPSNDNTDTGLLWSNLQALSVASFEDDILRALVLGRKAMGLPLVKLYMGCPEGMRDWYRQHVETVGPF
jgi:hypothetical protein